MVDWGSPEGIGSSGCHIWMSPEMMDVFWCALLDGHYRFWFCKSLFQALWWLSGCTSPKLIQTDTPWYTHFNGLKQSLRWAHLMMLMETFCQRHIFWLAPPGEKLPFPLRKTTFQWRMGWRMGNPIPFQNWHDKSWSWRFQHLMTCGNLEPRNRTFACNVCLQLATISLCSPAFTPFQTLVATKRPFFPQYNRDTLW